MLSLDLEFESAAEFFAQTIDFKGVCVAIGANFDPVAAVVKNRVGLENTIDPQTRPIFPGVFGTAFDGV